MTIDQAISRLGEINRAAREGGCPGCEIVQALVENFIRELESLQARRREA